MRSVSYFWLFLLCWSDEKKLGFILVALVNGVSALQLPLAVSYTMDIVHMHFEVVIPCKLLMAKLAFSQRTIGIMSHLVSDQHFLQAKSQVTNLEKIQRYQPHYTGRPEDSPTYHLHNRHYLTCCHVCIHRAKENKCSQNKWNLTSIQMGEEMN